VNESAEDIRPAKRPGSEAVANADESSRAAEFLQPGSIVVDKRVCAFLDHSDARWIIVPNPQTYPTLHLNSQGQWDNTPLPRDCDLHTTESAARAFAEQAAQENRT
jgi:hypothetical protein